MTELKGKIAIVTGASHPRGMGYAAALKLAEAGATVVLTDLPSATAELTIAAKAIAERGAKVSTFEVDVTDADQIRACVDEVVQQFGGIDILFNNAGVGIGSLDFLESSENEWDLSYDVNVKGMAQFCKAVLPSMITRGGGSIINNASLSGIGAIKGIPACYTASKFAAIGLTKSLAADFGDRNIRCNAICPGTIDTQMRAGALEFMAEAYGISIEEADKLECEQVALGRPGEPEEVADLVVYLASEKSSYLTGVAIPVAGGMVPGL